MPRVSISNTDKIFDVNEGEILYDSLYERGLELPHGCLSGSCGACRVEVTSGLENLAMPGVIEKNTIESLRAELKIENIRLSCRAKVIGDVTICPIK
jgi:ferredoxin